MKENAQGNTRNMEENAQEKDPSRPMSARVVTLKAELGMSRDTFYLNHMGRDPFGF